MSIKTAWKKACKSPLFNKKHKMCYAGVSREFVYDYLDPIFEHKKVPIPIEKHPLCNGGRLTDLKIKNVKKSCELKRKD